MVARLTKPRVFVVMPYGLKQGYDGSWIDFDSVYDLFKTALGSDFHIHRADKDSRTGDILEDMFKDILLADLVIVDVSIDNPNVWYEMGVRHTLQSRGVLMVKGTDRPMPFNLKPDRVFSYTLDPANETTGKRDTPRRPNTIEADAQNIHHWLTTLAAEKHRIDSPVYHNLRGLPEPDWRSLRMPALETQWQQLEAYKDLIDIAKRNKRPGDILTLASMPPNRALELEALTLAGQSLNKMGRFAFAKETLDEALAIDPANTVARQQRAIALGRMEKQSRAEAALRDLATDDQTGETLGLLGRIAKERWTDSFRPHGTPDDADLKTAAADQTDRLRDAADRYIHAFKKDPGDYFPGINALTLTALYVYFTGTNDGLPDVSDLRGGVTWALGCAMEQEKQRDHAVSFWSLATHAELALMSDASDEDVTKRYRRAARSDKRDWFGLDSARQQLVFLRQVGYRRALCDTLIATLTEERDTQHKEAGTNNVVLFAGHMVDAADRSTPRFPATAEAAARTRIEAELDRLGIGANDHVVTGAACGGDLLLLEAARARGASATVLLPQERAAFLRDSVTFADRDAGGTRWQDSFKKMEEDEAVEIRIQPEELGAAIALDPESGAGGRIYERNTIWLIYSALSMKAKQTHLLLLWNRQGGDGAGGTAHMAREMQRITGEAAIVIDPGTL